MAPPSAAAALAGPVALATSVAAIVAAVFGGVFYAHLTTTQDPMRGGGTVLAEEQSAWDTTYGFGAGRRLLVINLTTIGGIQQIHEDDKRHATLRAYGDSLHAGEAAEDGSTVYDIGIEFKGMSASGLKPGTSRRIQGAYSFEFWERDDDGAWDDAKATIFFEHSMEDFVLRSGAMDPTLVRDFAAPAMAGAEYERTLVELIFVQPGDVSTYEGVFMLSQGIKRRMLDKNGHIASNGKKGKCEDLDDGSATSAQALVDETVLLFEIDSHKYTNTLDNERVEWVGTNIEGDECLLGFSEHLWTDYPRCRHLNDTEDMTRCGLDVAYLNEMRRLHDILIKPPADPANPPAELAHAPTMENMAKQMVAELLLLDEGYGHESEHLFWAPLGSGETVRTLQVVLWDHDEPLWRSRNPDEADVGYLEHLTGSVWPHADPAAFLQFYATHQPFVDLIKANGAAWVKEANATIQAVIATRRAEHDAGYWQRHEQRWGFYGRLWLSPFPNHMEYYIQRNNEHMRIKATPALELDFLSDWMARRANSIAAWAPNAKPGDIRFVGQDLSDDVIMAAIVPLVAGVLVVLGLLVLVGLCAWGGASDFEAL